MILAESDINFIKTSLLQYQERSRRESCGKKTSLIRKGRIVQRMRRRIGKGSRNEMKGMKQKNISLISGIKRRAIHIAKKE